MQDVVAAPALPDEASAYSPEVTSLKWEQLDWVPFGWKPQANREPQQPRGRGVATYARRLMAAERARARRQTSPNLIAPARRRRLIRDGR
jgi:hypothetical protein